MNKGYEKMVRIGRRLDSFTYQWNWVHCKKIQCKSCPHGPYLVARYREGRVIRAIYIGRSVPTELERYVTKI